MEVLEANLPFRGQEPINLYPISDIHAGSIHCCERDIRRKVQEIANDSRALWIGLGDYADCILKDDKRFDIEGLAPWIEKGNIVESQRQWARELFSPIKDKCLGLLTGNHEEEIHLKYQLDFTRNLARDLNVPYGGYSCFLNLVVHSTATQRHGILVHAWHGAGAAQTEGARLMRLMRLVNDVQADIYLMGHLHAMTSHTPDRLIFERGKIRSVKLAATITGSWLKAYGQNEPTSYAERKGYKPSRIGCPIVRIHPLEHTFEVIS
jgi:hypothetical protein